MKDLEKAANPEENRKKGRDFPGVEGASSTMNPGDMNIAHIFSLEDAVATSRVHHEAEIAQAIILVREASRQFTGSRRAWIEALQSEANFETLVLFGGYGSVSSGR